ncbi:hypothetical protein FGRA07_11777 [Fusarium graminearum]|nr:hypothetical protein FGRA07_11777 [Fusarium graminearum]
MSGKVGTHWFPLVPGHEAVCVVVQVPEEAEPWGFQVGDLVGAPLWCEFCLECRSCKSERFEYCAQMKAKGVHEAGFFSEYTTLDAASVAKLGVSESVGVVGAGGLGQLATAYLTTRGYKVVVMDVQEKQLIACKEEYPGVETINSGNCSDLPAKVREVNNGNLLNAAFVTSGAKAAYDSTLPLLEPYGKLIVLGLPPKPVEISAYMMSDNRLRTEGLGVG